MSKHSDEEKNIQLCLWCYLAAFEMYVSPEIRCQIRDRNLVNVHYSKFYFKLEGMLIITAVPDIIMHSCAHYNSITVFYLFYLYLKIYLFSSRASQVGPFMGKESKAQE